MSTPVIDLTLPGANPNRYELFARLREMWINLDEPTPGTKDKKRTSSSLADYLCEPKQRVTQWATGSGGKSPAPWSVIMRLCHDLGLGVALHPKEGPKLYRL